MASERYIKLLDEMKDLHTRKNAGYAGHNPDPWANFRMSEAFGIDAFQGCLVRMSDKYIRVTNLVKDSSLEQVGENVKDTLMDLAAYALISICLLEEEEQKPAKPKCRHLPTGFTYVCAICGEKVEAEKPTMNGEELARAWEIKNRWSK